MCAFSEAALSFGYCCSPREAWSRRDYIQTVPGVELAVGVQRYTVSKQCRVGEGCGPASRPACSPRTPPARGLHSSTFRLNPSALYGIGVRFWVVDGVLRRCQGVGVSWGA